MWIIRAKYTDAEVLALIAIHAAIASAHHTDHQTASEESAQFKNVNIPTGEAYKQNAVNILRSKTIGNIFIGEKTGLLTTGNNNSFIGFEAGDAHTTGSSNVFIGYQSGFKNTNRNNNVFIGYRAGYNNVTGYNSLYLGYEAGFFATGGSVNAYIGHQAGYNNINGDYNVFIGYQAGYFELGSNLLYINNIATGNPLIWGDFTNHKVGIFMKPAVSKFGVADIPEYADNAAAVTAGLTVGEFYRTGDVLKIIHV